MHALGSVLSSMSPNIHTRPAHALMVTKGRLSEAFDFPEVLWSYSPINFLLSQLMGNGEVRPDFASF